MDRILTRHRYRRLSGPDHDDTKFVRLEFPKGSQRRRFPKLRRPSGEKPTEPDRDGRDANETVLERLQPSTSSASQTYKQMIKNTAKKRNDIFMKKAPGKRRRKRRPLLSSFDRKVVLPKKQDNPRSLNSKERRNEVDNTRLHVQKNENGQSDCEGSENKTNTRQNSDNGELVDAFGSDGDLNDDVTNTIIKSEDLSHARNDGTDVSVRSSHTDENSCSAVTSHDGDSIYSSECSSFKDRLSHAATDSDGGSIATNDSRRLSLNKHRQDQGHHKPAIDFRIGGRLEARDYLNMWYPSKIIQVDWEDKEVLIHFERWNSRFDEWVPMDSPRLRAIKRTSARKERKERARLMSKDYKVGEVVHAKWTDCKMYPAKIIKINADSTYNVIFYDGFERVVQHINIRKLPAELVGHTNFEDLPSKPGEKYKLPSGPKSEEVLPANPTVKSEIPPERRQSKDETPVKPKMKTLSSAKGNSVGIQSKKRKLLVGGIFQAKRRHIVVKPEIDIKIEPPDSSEQVQHASEEPPAASKSPPLDVSGNVKEESADNEVADVSQNVPQSESTDVSTVQARTDENPAVDGVSEDGNKKKRSSSSGASGVARKEFIIEEDHNHYKCLVDGCGKAFRKDVLLASHMKHYHRELSKGDSQPKKVGVDESSEIIEQKDVERSKPQEPVKEQVAQPPLKNEGNTERKLITEKRRQLLLQRRLERRHQQAAMALKAKLSKKSLPPSDKEDGSMDVSPRSEKLKTPSRKKKFVFTSRGVIKKLKKKKMEFENLKKSVLQDYENEPPNSTDGADEVAARPDLPTAISDEPPIAKVVLKGKRKRRSEQAISSDDSDKNVTIPNSDGVERIIGVEDKNVVTKLGKGSSTVSRNGIKLKTSHFTWHDSEREEVVNCRCQRQEEDGLMMQCEVCLAWQHGTCFDIEDEENVPEKYVCFACENPKGLRQSFKYAHNQDWFKTGDLVTFRFLNSPVKWQAKENIRKTHNLIAQMLAINNVLYSLQCKLLIAKDPKHPNLGLWSRPWTSGVSDVAEVDGENKVDIESSKEPETSQMGTWAFSDHSYSVPNRVYHDSHFIDNAIDAFLADHGDDKDLCLEVAANEVLDVQGTGPPVQDCLLDYCLEAKADTSDEFGDLKDSNEYMSDEPDSKSTASKRNADAADGTSKKGLNSVQPDGLKEGPRFDKSTEESLSKNRTYGAASSANGRFSPRHVNGVLFRPSSKTAREEEVDTATCQMNLMIHIEQLQEELDRRLDELDLELESMESEFEFPTLTRCAGDSLTSSLLFKRLLKAMTNDLMKVRRMALYC